MNQLFAGQLGKYVCVYLDDILIFSKKAAEHEEHLKEVSRILEHNKFYAVKEGHLHQHPLTLPVEQFLE